MDRTKPELLSLSGFYVAAGKAYMPTILDTDAGYFMDSEPVLIFDAFDKHAWTTALENSLSKPNAVVLASPMAPQTLVLGPHLEVSSQAELEKMTVYVSVTRLDTGFRIEALRRNCDGTWARGTAKGIDEYLPVSTSYNELAGRVIEYLRTRKD